MNETLVNETLRPPTSSDEHERLEQVADWFSTYDGFEHKLIEYGYRAIEPFFVGDSCLELGPADGSMTEPLLSRFSTLTSVEGSAKFCASLEERFARPGYDVVCSLFEEFSTDNKYDTVIAAHVLEHVIDPVGVLQRATEWVRDDGRLVVQVPNARSFHRLLGVKMGALESEYALNERDVNVGHRRVYDAASLRSDVEAAGWIVEDLVGSYFKVFSNVQSDAWFSHEMAEAFFELGKDFPENGTMIAAICRKA